jgi:acetoin utilization deacetylase AcuC-like enzyme
MKIALTELIQENKHPAPSGHPENPERMKYAVEHVLDSDIGVDIDIVNPTTTNTDCIYDVHQREYLDRVRELSEQGGGYLDGETFVGSQGFGAALETASAAIASVGAIINKRYKRIFLAGRPPGHHAEKNQGMGFCIINNAAVAAESLISNHNINRVAIIDWDVHHGNGTQNIFYSRPDVLYISLHQYPFYPGSGATSERGTGEGDGCTMNIPLPGGTGDDVYLQKFNEIVIPKMEHYKPEFILISCGFDAHRDDLLGGMNLSEQAFGTMTSLLVKFANEFSEGRIFSLFEGGYTPAANAASLYYHLKELQRD